MGKSRPPGPHSNDMTRSGAWPETDEDVYSNRAKELGGVLSTVTAALETWQSQQASIFNGPHVWSGDASKAAGTAVEGATKAMQTHQQQLRDAIAWCNDAASNITSAKDTITTNVGAGQQEIQSIEKVAAKTNQSPDGAIRAVVERKYGENVATINALAVGLGGKPDMPASPVENQTTTDSGAHGDPQSPDPNVPRQSQQPAGFQTVKGRGPAISAVPPPQSELPGGGEVVAGKVPAPAAPGVPPAPPQSEPVGGTPVVGGKGPARQHRQGFRQHRQGHQLSSLQPQALLPSVPFPRRPRQAWAADLRVRRA